MRRKNREFTPGKMVPSRLPPAEKEKERFYLEMFLSSNDILDHIKFCKPHGRLLCHYGKPLGVAELDIMHFRSSFKVVLAQKYHRLDSIRHGRTPENVRRLHIIADKCGYPQVCNRYVHVPWYVQRSVLMVCART